MQNGVLVVVAFPGDEADEHVLAQGDFTIGGGRTVSDNLTDLVTRSPTLTMGRWLMQVPCVGTQELDQLIVLGLALGGLDDHFIGADALDHAVMLRQNT